MTLQLTSKFLSTHISPSVPFFSLSPIVVCPCFTFRTRQWEEWRNALYGTEASSGPLTNVHELIQSAVRKIHQCPGQGWEPIRDYWTDGRGSVQSRCGLTLNETNALLSTVYGTSPMMFGDNKVFLSEECAIYTDTVNQQSRKYEFLFFFNGNKPPAYCSGNGGGGVGGGQEYGVVQWLTNVHPSGYKLLASLKDLKNTGKQNKSSSSNSRRCGWLLKHIPEQKTLHHWQRFGHGFPPNTHI